MSRILTYTRFGLWIANRNVRAGEDIRYLKVDSGGMEIPAIDYWIFDSNRLDIVLFDDQNGGKLLGADETTDPAREKAETWLNAAWNVAVPRMKMRRYGITSSPRTADAA